MPIQLPTFAQSVRSDRTTGTIVTDSGTTFNITEGTPRNSDNGTTLFHSFESFSPATREVVFNLQDSQNLIDTRTVTAIIGRVTGSASSLIDGQLTILQDGQTPTPNLFLINPNGILFGENARLSLPGSFFASTAESISFSDGSTFSTTNSSTPSLLTISAPVGLQFGKNTGSISLQGSGHAIATTNPTFAPYTQTGANLGLNVAPGQALRLIGGDIDIEGGILSAMSGSVDLGSVQSGTVSLTNRKLDYSGVEQFGDISLTRRSLVDISDASPFLSSAAGAGSVQLQGQSILLSDGSIIWSQNRGTSASGNAGITAAKQLSIIGTTPTVSAASGLIAETLAPGNAGTISINTPKLEVQAGATIVSRSFSDGNSGSVYITAEQASINGYAPAAPDIFSVIGTSSFSTGNAGKVAASIQELSITNGGYLGSSTLGSGNGGDVTVEAKTIEVIGTTPTAIASNIGATTIGGSGNSGNVALRTNTLSLQDSGLVSTASVGTGNAGDIEVNAIERIDISGRAPNHPGSTIASTVDFPPPGIKLLLGLSGTPRGAAGNVLVSTPILSISNDATVTVANLGEGNAGQLVINADTISVKQSAIDAFTQSGEGGNIALNIQDILLLQNGNVNATAQGRGNGGNLQIDSPIIIGIGDSDIIASAITGNGGNIDITTRGLFGLVARPQQTPESDITASSQFGISGTVSINNLAIQPEAALAELSDKLNDPNTQVAKSCADSSGNSFIASGRGGLPAAPANRLAFANPWEDLRAITLNSNVSSQSRIGQLSASQSSPFEADSWQLDASGQVILSATDHTRYNVTADCLT